MLTAIAEQYPHLCRAMRRRHGFSPDTVAQLILAARYPERAKAWTPFSCAQARRYFEQAISCRFRPVAI
jgi:hypothetical protein